MKTITNGRKQVYRMLAGALIMALGITIILPRIAEAQRGPSKRPSVSRSAVQTRSTKNDRSKARAATPTKRRTPQPRKDHVYVPSKSTSYSPPKKRRNYDDDRRRGNDRRYDDNRRRDSYKRYDSYRHHDDRYSYDRRRYTKPFISLFFPNIHLRIGWPWQVRYRRHWAPRYRYRQVVVVKKDWNHRVSSSRIELGTQYSHRVIYADEHSAELEIRIERIDAYLGGTFYGSITSIPEELSIVRARINDDGRVYFDRELFVIGDSHSGFELISTRYYDGYVMDEYRQADGYSAARLEFRKGRARRLRHSKLFRPHDARAFVPVTLLPEDQDWLSDVGPESVSAYEDDYNSYYGSNGRVKSTSDSQGRSRIGSSFQRAPLTSSYQTAFKAATGVGIKYERDTQLRRVE